MKISEMEGEKAFRIMAKLVPYVYKLNADDAISDIKEKAREAVDSPENRKEYFISMMPLLLGDHADDIFEMLAILNEESVKETKRRPFSEIAEQLKDCGTSEMMSFFGSVHRILAVM